ncbi:MAG: arginine--tRNA ligase [Chloroflexota bacterium]|nr:arginine--tRNA ligase [Chloroflexota bacterium]
MLITEVTLVKNQLAALVKQAIQNAQAAGALPAFDLPVVFIERPQKKEWGDFATSLPLKLARDAKRAPLQIAQVMAAHFPASDLVARVEPSAPGFVNIVLNDAWLARQVDAILAEGAQFGNLQSARRDKIQVEHVSVNPTGPMHVGSGRNGAIGDTLANVLQAAGHDVQREFYINDNGTQIRQFGASLFATYAQALGRDEQVPQDGYRGGYVVEMGKQFAAQSGDRYLQMPRAQAIRELGRMGIDAVLVQLRTTLERMDVRFDSWFSERSLHESGQFAAVLQTLKDKGLVFEKDDATWFAAQALGEEKDAVLVRSPQVIAEPDERPTYLASDVAYVWNKLAVRQFDRAIYVWGADHHGDVPRVLAAARALGLDPSRITILLYQFVTLRRGAEVVKMSKRTGEFVTLDELIEEVGADAVRFMLITRSADTAMDFDLDLAVQHSDENPVYYVQYAHARIASILRNAAEAGARGDLSTALRDGDVSLLTHPAELELIRAMLRFPEIVETAANKLEPHHLPHYAIDLAGTFHSFYKQCRVLSSDPADVALTRARLKLVAAARNTLARALNLMGVRAPESM